jgi:SGNH domain (fused to AT3 domains)
VVVSARWPTVGLEGAPYCHQSGEGSPCIAPPSLAAKQALVVAELKSAVGAALKAGKTVAMVDGSPESRFRVPERLAREIFWYGAPRLSVPASSLASQNAWLEPVFDAFRDTAGFHRVSLRGRLCDAAMCRVYDTALQRPIYIDESHFDPIWIATQADLFARFAH